MRLGGHLEIVKYLISTGKVSKRMGGDQYVFESGKGEDRRVFNQSGVRQYRRLETHPIYPSFQSLFYNPFSHSKAQDQKFIWIFDFPCP